MEWNMTVMTRRPERKIPVDTLREEHLKGPADEGQEAAAKALGVDEVVVVDNLPAMDWIIFRNQRDPGHVLEFHYSSKQCPFKQYKLVDGQKYHLPVEVIRNLEQCRENIEKYRRNSEGLPQIYVAGYKSHYVCERA
jgi:hypothetical protein